MKSLAPNTMIQNRYLIVHLVGKGGMGEVYLAVDQRLGSAVALKRTFFADNEMLGNAFEREAKILARLRHPVLPKVSDHFLENGEQYLVMEHISGDDLSKRLEGAQKPFPLSWVMFWADQLLDALTYLHSHEPPIIHRDIKPQNLKLTDENHIILLDFGLSKDSAGLTKTDPDKSGSVVGYTPHFASMEQIRGTGTNARSDIYSLSATLYQLMTNSVPLDALARADALLSGLEDPILSLSDLNPEIPQVVSDVILKGVEVSQDKRFATAAEMQKALRRAYTQTREAMSAQTAVFGMDSEPVFKSDDSVPNPTGVALDSAPSLGSPIPSAASEMPTGTQPQIDSEPMDKTLKMSPAEAESEMKQADVKTEVLLAGDMPHIPSADEQPAPVEQDWAPATVLSDDLPAIIDDVPPYVSDRSSEFEPAATTPVISLGNVDQPASPEFFTSPNIEPAAEPPTPHQPQPMSPPPPKKSSSKAGLIIGGLGGLFVLGLIAIGAGWYLYANYYASTIVTSTPTPMPSIEITPSPAPTADTLAESNSNVDSNSQADVSSSSNSSDANQDLTVGPTPAATPGAFSTTRPTPQVVTQNPAAKTTKSPTAKATPKPKPRDDRTVILQ